MSELLFRKVATDEERQEVFRLRYKVYCEEWGFEKPEDHPGWIEKDEFDARSVHFVAKVNKDGDERIIGTVRIILPSDKGFPIEKHCRITSDLSGIDRKKIGEISRLAISKDYRKRLDDAYYENKDLSNVVSVPAANIERRRSRQAIVCGLYRSIYIESKEQGLTHWYAVMTMGLYTLLKRIDIVLKPIGPEVDYHGFRTPYIASIAEIEQNVAGRRNELFCDLL